MKGTVDYYANHARVLCRLFMKNVCQ